MKKIIMKKLFYLIITNAIVCSSFAQCITKEDAYNTPTTCTKAYEGSYMPTAEQEKWMTSLFTSVVEPAIKSTKGFRGTWKPMGKFSTSKIDGFVRTEITMYMNGLTCTKDQKLFEKHEAGLVLNFCCNTLWNMGNESWHMEYKWIKGNAQEIQVNDKIDGNQIYILSEETFPYDDKKFVYYRKEKDGEYFIISKPGVPLFIPLTIKQALTIKKQNILHQIETKYESSYIETQQKMIQFIDDYMATTSEKILEKPCISRYDYLSNSYFSMDDLKMVENYREGLKRFVIINPAYINHAVSTTAPQFMSVVLRTQGNSPVTLKGYNDFKANLELDKLRAFLK